MATKPISKFTIMKKTIYCVCWRWFDENGNEILPRKCCTHSWFTSYRKARINFEEQQRVLYGNYPERRLECDSPKDGWSPDDGTYELSAVKIYAIPSEKSHLRLVLAATDMN